MADALESLIGDNRPPRDLLTGDALQEQLRDEHLPVIMRKDQLLEAYNRMPGEITDAATAGKAADFIKQITACIKAADSARVGAKEPYLEGGRAVDGFFKAVTNPLDYTKQLVNRRLTVWQQRVEAEERARRMEEERLAREAAEAKRREAEAAAQAARDARALDDAILREAAAKQAEADAAKAAAAAAAKPAELSRTRGEYGSLASLRTDWVFDNLDRDALDLEALRQHFPSDGLEKAVRAFIKAGGRDLRGVRIFETTTAVVR
jgi:regulator of protease activity HflC (stomatin/prohibitin superfamily)